jgi:hypothetical protein
MDPMEEKVVKLYLTSIATLIAFAVMFGTVASFQNAQFVPQTMEATVINK